MNALAVAVGGALGALARYGLAWLVQRHAGAAFPAGTFVVNVGGCLIFGLLAGWGTERGLLGPGARAFLLVGVVGGFTTFSTYAYESLALLRDGQTAAGLLNLIGQMVLGVAALWGGLALSRIL